VPHPFAKEKGGTKRPIRAIPVALAFMTQPYAGRLCESVASLLFAATRITHP